MIENAGWQISGLLQFKIFAKGIDARSTSVEHASVSPE
jgi:hypothetical protein